MCSLYKHRNRVVVPAVTGVAPQVMFVGEAPGCREDKVGKPFVGRAGKWHQRIVKAIDVRKSHIVINCVQCRPVLLDGNNKVAGNGKPTKVQMMKCFKWIELVMNQYRPKLLILYGTFPINNILGFDSPIRPYVGKFYEVSELDNVIAFATYHPSCLDRNKPKYLPIFNKHVKQLNKYLYGG